MPVLEVTLLGIQTGLSYHWVEEDEKGRCMSSTQGPKDQPGDSGNGSRRDDVQRAFETVFREAVIPMALVDMRGTYVEVNSALLGMLGRSAEDLRRERFQELTQPEGLEADLDLFGRLVRGRRDRYQIETRFSRTDGGSVWGKLTVSLIRDENDEPLYAIAMVESITERMKAEEELRESFALVEETDRERRRLLLALITAHEEERLRIAREIHDDPIQSMTAVGIRLGILHNQIPDEQSAQTALAELEEAVSDATTRLRNLAFELHPRALDWPGSLRTVLRESLRLLAENAGVEVTLDEQVTDEPSPEARAICYRIAQEALANVRKHANATKVDVLIESSDDGIHVRIQDDGIGFPASRSIDPPGHLGLASMKGRAELAGGWWNVQSSPGQGTVVEFWVPTTGTTDGARQ